MKNKYAIAFAFCGLLTGTCSFSGTMGLAGYHGWHAVVGGGGGLASSSNFSESKNFPITTAPGLSQFYDYTKYNGTQSRGFFEVFLGGERELSPLWLIQPGVAYSQVAPYHVDGALTQGLAPQSADRFTYHYNVTIRQLLAQTKLMRRIHERFYPYFLLGLGASMNTASNFSTDITENLISTRSYSNHYASSFSYRVGAGFDMDLFPHSRIGVAYRYAGLGLAGLSNPNIHGVPVSGTLTKSQINQNEVLFQLTIIV